MLVAQEQDRRCILVRPFVLAIVIAGWFQCGLAFAESGIACQYSDLSKTASGRSYPSSALVAAHRTLPFGTSVLVQNRRNGKSVVVTIVDRGPFIKNRVIDLSTGAAAKLGFAGLEMVDLSVEK